MAATAHTEVFRPAGSICCSDQPPASNDVESCSAPLRGLTIRYQKRAVLFPRRHGLPTCENCAWGALGGRQQRARFAHLGLRTASPSKLSIAYRHSPGAMLALASLLVPRGGPRPHPLPPASRPQASPPPEDRAIILTYTLTSPSPDDCARAKKETILRRDPNLHPNLRCPNWLDAT